MRYRLWRDISEALSQVRTLADQTIPRLERTEPSAEAQEVLEWLHGEVLQVLLDLKKRLEAATPDDIVLQMLGALVLLCDELILTRLPARLNRSWPLLQGAVLERGDGGAYFYRRLEELLHDSRCPPEVLQVYFYCLSNGFQGHFADNPEGRAAIVERLRARLPTAPVLLADEVDGLPPPRAFRRFPWRYYAVAVAIALFMWPLCRWASNLAPWAGLMQAGESTGWNAGNGVRSSGEEAAGAAPGGTHGRE